MFDLESFLDRVVSGLLTRLLPKLEAALKLQPRWLSYESAAAYMDKTYDGLRHTLKAHENDLPVSKIGGAPRIDREDIDRLGLKLKARRN